MGMETSLSGEAQADDLGGGPVASTDGLSAEVLAEHLQPAGDAIGGDEARRRGRPPIHGMYSRAAGSDGKHPAALPGNEPLPTPEVDLGTVGPSPRVSIPPDLLTKVIQESLTLGESGIAHALEGQGKLAGLTVEEIAPQLKRAELGERRKQLVAELAPYAAQEWGLDSEVSPTVAIGLLLVPWSLGAFMAYVTLAGLAKEKAEAEAAREREVNIRHVG